MRHWSQLATRNWRVRRVRTLGALLAIALGTGAVVWVTCCYESVRRTVMTWASSYVGGSHLTLESPLGKYDQLPERLVERVAAVDGVGRVVCRLVQRLCARPVRRVDLESAPDQTRRWIDNTPEVDLHGIDVEGEPEVRTYQITEGRMLGADDEFACVLEALLADTCGVGVGDALLVWTAESPQAFEFEIVGLTERRRIIRFQKGMALVPLPVLQRINNKQQLITSIDVVLEDASRENVRAAAKEIRRVAQRVVPNVNVRSAEIRMRQIQAAQDQQAFVLGLLSCVAMLTALVTILSTLSMGMIERIGQLGLLRCCGTTRMQLALLVLFEVLPLGVVSIGLGVPIGLGLTWLTALLVPDYVGSVTLNRDGLLLAVAAGLATTLVAALLPALAAVRVSPMEAARPRARSVGRVVVLVMFVVGVLLLAVQHLQVFPLKGGLGPITPLLEGLQLERNPWFMYQAGLAVVLLYVGYALAAPLAVWLVGSSAVVVVARLIWVRTRLLQDQVGHAVWRSAGICCGLMVGLSLIVGLVTFNESVTSGWQFPKKFPEAYVWSFEQMRDDADQIVAEVPGVKNHAVANAVNVIVRERPGLMKHVYLSVTWFLGCDPDTFFDLLKLEFLEGDEASARALLKQGGYVIVAEDFSRSRNKHLGDRIKVWLGQRDRDFRIAGVVESPALEVAAGYFQMQSEANVAASGSVLGTNADLKRLFGVHGVRLVLLNFAPPGSAPADWPPARDSRAGVALPDYCYDDQLSRDDRWERFREQQVLATIRQRLQAPQAFGGSVRELKDEIDRELMRITGLLAAVPTVALIVAALGVANLMAANVASRRKELAILRAVGAPRGHILRMVIGEALVLGLLGSALGLGLGVHLAESTTTMVDLMWGYRVDLAMPWMYVLAAVVLTIGLCVIAGVIPARHASRTDIVDALHVA